MAPPFEVSPGRRDTLPQGSSVLWKGGCKLHDAGFVPSEPEDPKVILRQVPARWVATCATPAVPTNLHESWHFNPYYAFQRQCR